jgi:hypothetical protein
MKLDEIISNITYRKKCCYVLTKEFSSTDDGDGNTADCYS